MCYPDLWTARAMMALRLERQPPWIEFEALLGRAEVPWQRRRVGPVFRLIGQVGRWLVALGRHLERYGQFRPSVQIGK